MPGRTPHDAVDASLQPLRLALGCLQGTAKITRQGGRAVGQEGQWTINNQQGMILRGVGTLYAQQRFRLVECDPDTHDIRDGTLRVTTLAYDYELTDEAGAWLWRMHWHPTGRSHVTVPHVHLRSVPGHLQTPRLALENAVQWAHEFGARMRREDWKDVLYVSVTAHTLYRTWSTEPSKT